MFSKRIVISIIVIGCLVQFITCPSNNPDDKNKNFKSPSKSPKKPSTAAPTKPSTAAPSAKPRGLPPNNNKDPKAKENGKAPAKPAVGKPPAGKPMKPNDNQPAAADNKKGIPENAEENPGGDEEEQEEKPVGRIRKAFRRINSIRKRYCPVRFFGRLVKKTFGFRQKPKPTDEEETET